MQYQSATTPLFPTDVTQFLKIYAENVGKWQKNYEKILSDQLNQMGGSQSPGATLNVPAGQIMQNAEAFTRQLVENQIEVWNFLSKRLEKDQAFQSTLSKCKTPEDLVGLYADFYGKMFNDYADEMKKLSEPYLRMWSQSAEAISKFGQSTL